MAAGLTWTMGSELLFDPWQPARDVAAVPVLRRARVVARRAAISCCCRSRWRVASLVLETHLSYAVLVPVLAIWGTGALAWTIWQRRRRDPDGWPEFGARCGGRRWSRRSCSSCLGAPVHRGGGARRVTEPQPVWSARSASEADRRLGLRVDGWSRRSCRCRLGGCARPSATRSCPRATDVRCRACSRSWRTFRRRSPRLASLVLVLGVLGVLCRDARRRTDGTASARWRPRSSRRAARSSRPARCHAGFFGIAPHQFRWLWPISLFILFAALLAIARRSPPVHTHEGHRRVRGRGVASAVINLPTNNQRVGRAPTPARSLDAHTRRSTRGQLDGSGTLLFDVSGLRFAEPYSVPVMNELDRRGVEIVVTTTAWCASSATAPIRRPCQRSPVHA